MKQAKQSVRLLLSLTLGLSFILLSSCMHDRVVINGETAQHLAEVVNAELLDPDRTLRGNTATNIYNGGYVISDQENIWFINPMRFEDGSEIHYLQHMLTNQIGSVTTRNNFLVELEGLLIGKYEDQLFAIDYADGNKLVAFDLDSYAREIIFESPVSSVRLVGDTLYWSTTEGGDLWQLHLYGKGTQAKLILKQAGTLIGIQSQRAYTLRDSGDEKVLVTIDIAQERELGLLRGGTYEHATIAGSWVFFTDEGCLKRQRLSGGEPIVAFMCNVAEYAVEGHWLAVIRASGGIVVSQLDGTGVAKVSDDLAEGLQLVDNRIYYRNGYDNNATYTIDLIEGKRSSLLGASVTDGGIQFESIPKEHISPWVEKFGGFAEQVLEIQAFTDQMKSSLQGEILFVELDPESNDLVFHRLKEAPYSPAEVGVLVVISHFPTLLGQYTDGDLAYRQDSALTVFTPGNPKPYLTWYVEGRPPSEIKVGSGDRYGLPLSWHQKGLDLIELIHSLR